jgi:hypothetical protein
VGLSNITFVGSDLRIRENTALINLDGLSNITFVGGDLKITDNAALTNLEGLNNIDSVDYLEISGNAVLANINGLRNITFLGGGLYVSNNDALTNLDGLKNITSIVGSLIIDDNDVLTNLDGLINITKIVYAYNIYIENNAVLTNLDGLSNIDSVGGDLVISGNSSLDSFCGLFPLLSDSGLGGNYFVSDNLLNPTQQQIIDDGPCATSISTEIKLKPLCYELLQNYPNPFNPQTTIVFNVKELTSVILKIYNINGQLVSTLIDKRMQAGHYEIKFDGSDSASGVYFYQIKMGKYLSTKKMILLQ